MCGRFTQTSTPAIIAEAFHLPDYPLLTPNYNVAPSQSVAAVRLVPDSSTRECVLLRWGLIPSWAKDTKIGNQCINAKGETVAVKPAFRGAFKKRRCLIISDGFFEWQRQGTRKQPFWIGRKDRRPFAFAGLWEHWHPPEGQPLETCTIITTEPNELMAPIHTRMPVILSPASYDQWLDPASAGDALQHLLRPSPNEELQATPVSTLINNPRYNAPVVQIEGTHPEC
jgi:putative SOS response-associated peptidase YedK